MVSVYKLSSVISLLGTVEGVRSDWFAKNMVVKIGDGFNTSFWLDPWVQGSTLKIGFLTCLRFQLSGGIKGGRWAAGKIIGGCGSLDGKWI